MHSKVNMCRVGYSGCAGVWSTGKHIFWISRVRVRERERERDRVRESERERGRGGERGNRLRSDLCHVVVFTDIFETKTYSSYINEGLTEVWCWPPHE